MLSVLEDFNNPWPSRFLLTHIGRWNSGEVEKHKYKRFSIKNEKYSLVNNTELYDLANDLGQATNIASEYPEVVQQLQKQYDVFWNDIQPHLVNEGLERTRPVQPYFTLYKDAFGKEAFDIANEKGKKDRVEYHERRIARMKGSANAQN